MADEPRKLLEDGKEKLKKGDWESASTVLETLIKGLDEGMPSTEDERILVEGLRLKAFADSRMGKLGLALDLAKRALDISIRLGDVEGEADSLRRLGYVHWLKSDYDKALELYKSALEKADSCGARDLTGKTKIEVANTFVALGSFEKARTVYLEAAGILEEVGDLNELARAYNNLGDCHIRLGDLDEAIESLRRCMDIADKIGDLTIKGWAAFNAAECFIKMKELDTAKQYLEMALEHLERCDDRIGVAFTLSIYGMAFTAEKEWALAEDSYNKSVAMFRELQMPVAEGGVLRDMAMMYATRGEKDLARGNLRIAIQVFERADRKEDAERTKGLLDGIE